MSGLAIQLDGADNFVLFQEMGGVLGQQRVYLAYIVSLGQLNGSVPLVQVNTAVNGLLYMITLERKQT